MVDIGGFTVLAVERDLAIQKVLPPTRGFPTSYRSACALRLTSKLGPVARSLRRCGFRFLSEPAIFGERWRLLVFLSGPNNRRILLRQPGDLR